ncbi:MAG: hypothetical protein ACFE8N_01265 [Promethearchaeota archaeon]
MPTGKRLNLLKKKYSTKLTKGNQISLFNCYPEDSELNQSSKGFNFMSSGPNDMLAPGNSIVLMSSSYEGKGFHSLVGETGAKLYRTPGDSKGWKAVMSGRTVFFFSPNISKPDLNHYFPEDVRLIKDWKNLIAELEIIHGKSPKVALVPTSIQLIEK